MENPIDKPTDSPVFLSAEPSQDQLIDACLIFWRNHSMMNTKQKQVLKEDARLWFKVWKQVLEPNNQFV